MEFACRAPLGFAMRFDEGETPRSINSEENAATDNSLLQQCPNESWRSSVDQAPAATPRAGAFTIANLHAMLGAETTKLCVSFLSRPYSSSRRAESRATVSCAVSSRRLARVGGLVDTRQDFLCTVSTKPINGVVVKRTFAANAIDLTAVVLEESSGERNLIDIDPLPDDVPAVERGWIVSGLQKMLKKGNRATVYFWACGAAGRVLVAQRIVAHSLGLKTERGEDTAWVAPAFIGPSPGSGANPHSHPPRPSKFHVLSRQSDAFTVGDERLARRSQEVMPVATGSAGQLMPHPPPQARLSPAPAWPAGRKTGFVASGLRGPRSTRWARLLVSR